MTAYGKPLPGTPLKWGHPLTKGLLAYFPMLEGGGSVTRDLVKGLLATITAPSWSGSRRGGRSLNFDGGGSYLNLGNVAGQTNYRNDPAQGYSNPVKTVAYWVQSNVNNPGFAGGMQQYIGGMEFNSWRQGVWDLAHPKGLDPNGSVYIDGVLQNLYGANVITNADFEGTNGWSAYNGGTPTYTSDFRFHGSQGLIYATTFEFSGITQAVATTVGQDYILSAGVWTYQFTDPAPARLPLIYVDLNDATNGDQLVLATNVCNDNSHPGNPLAYYMIGAVPGSQITHTTMTMYSLTWNNSATLHGYTQYTYHDDQYLRPLYNRFPIKDTAPHLVVITDPTGFAADQVRVARMEAGQGWGGTWDTTQDYGNYKIDDMRFYDRVLTQDEIYSMYRDPYALFAKSRSFVSMLGQNKPRTLKPLYDETFDSRGWFDASLVAYGLFDEDLSDTPVPLTASVAELLGVADAPSTIATFAGTVGESCTISDGPSAVATFVATEAESQTITDAPSAALPQSAAIAESSSATDAPSAVVTFAATIAESQTAADSPSAVATFPATVAESQTPADTPSAALTTAATIAESSTPSDTPTASLAFPVTDAESTTVSDTVSAAVTFAASDDESTAASDTVTATLGNTQSVDETNPASDSQSVTASFVASDNESTTPTDAPTATAVFPATQAESTTPSDTQSATYTTPAAQAESAAATETQSAAAVFAATEAESTSTVDSLTATVGNEQAVSESTGTSDTQAATKTTIGAIVAAIAASEIYVPAFVALGLQTETSFAVELFNGSLLHVEKGHGGLSAARNLGGLSAAKARGGVSVTNTRGNVSPARSRGGISPDPHNGDISPER